MAEVAREVLWARIPDFRAPAEVDLFDEQLGRVCTVLGGGGHVHVSCFGGIGRTGVAIACIRVHLLGETPDDALAAAFDACGGPMTEGQDAFVHATARRLRVEGNSATTKAL
jgi:protein-tyrosine phosphatase